MELESSVLRRFRPSLAPGITYSSEMFGSKMAGQGTYGGLQELESESFLASNRLTPSKATVDPKGLLKLEEAVPSLSARCYVVCIFNIYIYIVISI